MIYLDDFTGESDTELIENNDGRTKSSLQIPKLSKRSIDCRRLVAIRVHVKD